MQTECAHRTWTNDATFAIAVGLQNLAELLGFRTRSSTRVNGRGPFPRRLPEWGAGKGGWRMKSVENKPSEWGQRRRPVEN
jgi:hypothetical protein